MIPSRRSWIFTLVLITLGAVFLFLTSNFGRMARLIPEKVADTIIVRRPLIWVVPDSGFWLKT